MTYRRNLIRYKHIHVDSAVKSLVDPVHPRRVLDLLDGVEAAGGASAGNILETGAEQSQKLFRLVALRWNSQDVLILEIVWCLVLITDENALIVILWWNMSTWDWMLRRQWNGRIWDPHKMIGSLLILLICFAKYTQVSFFTVGHFQPTPFPFLSNALSLTQLICSSLSLTLSLSLSLLTPHSVYTCWYFT